MVRLMNSTEFREEIARLKKQTTPELFTKVWRKTQANFQQGRSCLIIAEPTNTGIFAVNLPEQISLNQGFFAEYHAQKSRLGQFARPELLEELLTADFIELLSKNLSSIK